jgi:hypothetical protein
MKNFTIAELYEISDALSERRKRLIDLRAILLDPTDNMISKRIDEAKSAHTKIMDEIVTRTSTL